MALWNFGVLERYLQLVAYPDLHKYDDLRMFSVQRSLVEQPIVSLF